MNGQLAALCGPATEKTVEARATFPRRSRAAEPVQPPCLQRVAPSPSQAKKIYRKIWHTTLLK